MNKAELVRAVAARAGITKASAKRSIDAVFAVMAERLKKGEDVSIYGFGTFKVKERAAREGINPKTGERIQIPERKTVVFKPAKGIKKINS